MTAAAVAILALVLPSAEPADTATRVALVTTDGSVALSKRDQSEIARRVQALIVGCGINSVASPDIFSARSLPEEWHAARAAAHLYVRFPKPILTRHSRVPITEVVIGLREPTFIGPELSRHADQVVGHVKCDGHRGLALMCATALKPHLLPGQRANCGVYDRIGEPREPE